MNTSELKEATKEFDQPFVFEKSRPLTAAERERWESAKRKPARSGTSTSVQTIAVHVDSALLKRSDTLAKRKGLTRDALIDRALKSVLAMQESID